jgi:Fe2+ or Zn2+ uptake regulation protein
VFYALLYGRVMIMKTIGVKFAKSVQAVLKVLPHISHATVQQVMDAVNAATTITPPQQSPLKTKPLSLTSTYRALNTLVALGTVKPLHFNDGQVRYELNYDKPHHTKLGKTTPKHHHHFVCTQCSKVDEIEACPVAPLIDSLSEQYTVQYHTFEVFGLCNLCAPKHP